VLNGDLGVAPGTSLVGFGSPAVVNGATHANDAVAQQAQRDLTTAYDVAAGQPVSPGNVLTGTDLGNRTLGAGAYRYDTSAQLTGQLTLDAAGDPNAQFVFEIGSTLTTASASSVRLINGASPCNVYWQVGSSATLDTTTAFQGNVLALTSISLNNGASVIGRVLARNGAVTLDNNVLDNTQCTSNTSSPPPPGETPPATTPPGETPPGETAPGETPPGETAPGETAPGETAPGETAPGETAPGETAPGETAPGETAPGETPPGETPPGETTPGETAPPGLAPSPVTDMAPPQSRSTVPTRNGTAIIRRTARDSCRDGFRATVRGKKIERVVFRIDGRRIASRTGSPFSVYVGARAGRHNVSARVTFTDATRAKTLNLGYRACAAKLLRPRPGPSPFTG
jgi:type VI secretion system secreted protein VgrG